MIAGQLNHKDIIKSNINFNNSNTTNIVKSSIENKMSDREYYGEFRSRKSSFKAEQK